jgi:hypothetical protein
MQQAGSVGDRLRRTGEASQVEGDREPGGYCGQPGQRPPGPQTVAGDKPAWPGQEATAGSGGLGNAEELVRPAVLRRCLGRMRRIMVDIQLFNRTVGITNGIYAKPRGFRS